MPIFPAKKEMMVNVYGAKCIGIEAVPVTVEIDIMQGIGIHLVGLADAAVKESLLRTVTALQSRGFHIPGRKIVINLAPADMHKNGSGYDLPIAIGIIAASGQGDFPELGNYIVMGELGLDGSVRHVPGALPMVDLAVKSGRKGCILPVQSALEAVDNRMTAVYGVKDINDVFRILGGREPADDLLIWNSAAAAQGSGDAQNADDYPDFADIIGQEGAKRGLEVAAAGNHNVLLLGQQGVGKTSLARALAGILPPMTKEESAVTGRIYSVAGPDRPRAGSMYRRPFRAPSGCVSVAAILGGGKGDNIMPGEVSLATNGVLFLDEFIELPRTVTEALRGPLEDRTVTVSRLRSKVTYPASFMLVAASNPCPCGYYGDGDRCTCTPGRRASYLSRLSGPVMDRIDIQLFLHPVDSGLLMHGTKGEPSSAVAARVLRAREIQLGRFRDEGIFTNAEMSVRQTEKFCSLSTACRDLMGGIMERRRLSARACNRIVKISRTIADLRGEPDILPEHLSEAAGYRFLDRQDGIL